MYAMHTPLAPWIRNGSHTRHHTQWHRHSYAICAACASPMCHWYAVDTQHMRNSSVGDVPPNHLGDLAAYLLFFSYTVWAPWHRRPVEQGHYHSAQKNCATAFAHIQGVRFSSNNWNPRSATFYATRQGVPAELGFQSRNGNFLYMDPTSQDIGKYTHMRNWLGDLL